MKHTIIGLGHYRRTGKDTLADFILAEYGRIAPGLRGIKQSFAHKLKQICHNLYGWAGLCEPEWYDSLLGAPDREIVLPRIGKSPRQIWIDFGTKAVREQVYDRTWVDYLLNSWWRHHSAHLLIIPDVRFPNEVAAIREADGILIKVVRPGYAPGDDPADQALVDYDGWDYVVSSGGLMAKLRPLQAFAASFVKWQVGEGPQPEWCGHCKEAPGEEPHMCPYGFTVDGDETLCNCCDDCQVDCDMHT